jgi:hypothetical protein
MAMRLGVGDALVEQPGVQFIKVLEPQPGREEPLADQPDLVLDLTLLPARCRSAGDRLDEGAVAICVGIDFGALSSMTRLPDHAARSIV